MIMSNKFVQTERFSVDERPPGLLADVSAPHSTSPCCDISLLGAEE